MGGPTKPYKERQSYLRTWSNWRRELTMLMLDCIKDTPCADCGLKYPSVCMDFDHVRGEKEFDIGRHNNRAIERVLNEIAKCDVICSNCHRIRTAKRSGWRNM